MQRQSQYIEEFYAREGWKSPPKPEARTTHLGIEPGGIMMERHLALVSHKDTYFDADQLYDLQGDPMEQNNLASSPEYQEVLKRMKKLLSEYIAKLPETFGEF